MELISVHTGHAHVFSLSSSSSAGDGSGSEGGGVAGRAFGWAAEAESDAEPGNLRRDMKAPNVASVSGNFPGSMSTSGTGCSFSEEQSMIVWRRVNQKQKKKKQTKRQKYQENIGQVD